MAKFIELPVDSEKSIWVNPDKVNTLSKSSAGGYIVTILSLDDGSERVIGETPEEVLKMLQGPG
jgi:hypothetical protein